MTSLPPPADHVLGAVQSGEAESVEPTRSRWLWVALAGLVFAVAILAFAFLRGGGDTAHFVTQAASRGGLIVQVTATGTLQPTNQVEVGTEISGKIAEVFADYNDAVKVGQVLARIDTTRLEAQAQQSRAALLAAQAKVLQCEATRTEVAAQLARITRMRTLTNDDVPSASDVDSAEATLARAEADLANARALVQQSRATLEAQQIDLKKAEIRSPIEGIVLQRAVEAGQTVAASLQAPVLFVIAENLKQMELHVDTDEADVATVTAGQKATFSVDAFPDQPFDAQVKEVYFGARTVSGVVTYETVLTVDNSDLRLRPGMTATASIVVKHLDDVLRVPNAALRFSPESATVAKSGGGGLVSQLLPRMPIRGQTKRAPQRDGVRQVWTLQAGQPVPIEVQTGATDGLDTQILAGSLSPGTAVIVDAAAAGS